MSPRLVAKGEYNDLAASGLPFTQSWRFGVDAERLDSDRVEGVIADVQRMQSQFITSSTVSVPACNPCCAPACRSCCGSYVAERSSSEAALSVAAIGPSVLAAAAVGMVGILIASRRRAAIALTRGRGASTLVLIGAQLWEAIVLVGLAVMRGHGRWILAGARARQPGIVPLVVAVGIGAVAALAVGGWPAARRPLRELHADETPVLRPSSRRLVLEGTAVLVAIGGIFLLQQRGLTIGSGPADHLRSPARSHAGAGRTGGRHRRDAPLPGADSRARMDGRARAATSSRCSGCEPWVATRPSPTCRCWC